MKQAQISVIIPVYNHAKALQACLRSLKRQTFRDFEIIIVDDGSKEAVPGATIRFDKNRGAPAARNAGFAESRGEFVIFLDADAVLKPEALQKMKDALDTNPDADFVYSGFRFGFKTFRSQAFDAQALRQANYIHTSALIRREAFPGFDEALKKFQDWDLFLTMSEQGRAGCWIDEELFALKARGTMSNWMPKIVFKVPWPVFGYMPKTIKKYREAEKIIRHKHKLLPPERASFWKTNTPWVLGIILLEMLSIPAAYDSGLNSRFALVFGFAMFLLAIFRPQIAFAALVTEFVIGSKGRLLAIGANAYNDLGLALRIILFGAFILGWIGSLIREKRLPSFTIGVAWSALVLSLFMSFLKGWMARYPAVITDANAWGILLLLIPALDLATRYGKGFWDVVKQAFSIGIAWVIAKTLFLFAWFSHDVGNYWEPVYRWIRRTGVGEVTQIVEQTSAFRVFFQSHVYQVLAAFVFAIKGKRFWMLVGCLATIIISFSRSFWIGSAVGLLIFAAYVLRRKSWNLLKEFLGASVLAVMLVVALFFIPPQSGFLSDAFLARFNLNENAAASRWTLLPILTNKIREAPMFGHGFGATVTYQSSDPRITAATGGVYTTHAFEWGWLDMAIKTGLVGTSILMWIIISLISRISRSKETEENKTAMIAVIVVLSVIHFFTPYLNHPLGLLILILLEARLAFKMS